MSRQRCFRTVKSLTAWVLTREVDYYIASTSASSLFDLLLSTVFEFDDLGEEVVHHEVLLLCLINGFEKMVMLVAERLNGVMEWLGNWSVGDFFEVTGGV